MRLVILLAAAGLLAGCATHATSDLGQQSTTFLVTLPDDSYRFEFMIDTAHDTSNCDPAIPLTNNEVPPSLQFTFYPCTGRAFTEKMRVVAAKASATGKIWQLYRTVPRVNGKDVGRTIVVGTPRPNPLYTTYSRGKTQ